MAKYFNKLKKPCFWTILGPFLKFLGKKSFPRKSGSVTHNFIWVSRIVPKFRNRRDERTNRCYFIGPFRLLLGIQKRFPLGISSVNVSKYTVEMVRIISNDKHKEFTHSRNLHLPPLHLPNNVIGHLTVLTKLMPSSNRILTKNMVN